MGKGTKGKSQAQDFHTLAKTLSLDKGKGFGESGSGSAWRHPRVTPAHHYSCQ